MGKSRVRWVCFLFLKLNNNFRRCSPFKRILIITVACLLYLFFVFSQVGLSQRHPRRGADEDEQRHTRGSDNLEKMNRGAPGATPVGPPTRSNVVYITLKSKRVKPAHIRGTIRPKLRKKVRRKKTKPPVTQNKLGTAEHYAGQDHFGFQSSWKQTPHEDYESLTIISNDGADAQISSIRIYSQMTPPWFSAQDLKTMRFLADAKVLRVKKMTLGDSPSLLIFEGEATVPLTNKNSSKKNAVCGGLCGVIHRSVDNSEVFAFHLDRVLALNRTLPAVSRKFRFLPGRLLNTRETVHYYHYLLSLWDELLSLGTQSGFELSVLRF